MDAHIGRLVVDDGFCVLVMDELLLISDLKGAPSYGN